MSAPRIDPDRLVGEKRVGRRGEQKRRWDKENRQPCSDGCGKFVWHGATRCLDCRIAADHEKSIARRREIQRRWSSGETRKEIATALGSTKNAIGTAISSMRQEGWDVPYRHAGYPRRG
jgi:biotin operon repressor